jgi:hypothetical protein
MIHEPHTYADLQKQMHDDLRIQHPEWIEANGECPTCDSYEARLVRTIMVLAGQHPSISYDRNRPDYHHSIAE